MPRLAAPLFILFGLSLTLPIYAEETRHITVSGEGIVHATPDIATTTFSFSQRSKKADQGKRLLDTQVTNLLKLCKKLGIEDRDIYAANLNIYPEYDHRSGRQFIGYRVSRDVRVKVRKIGNYPKLLDGAVGIGASHSGSPALNFSNRKAIENKAMLQALEDAKTKAALLAKAGGGNLGAIIWINETGAVSTPPMAARFSLAQEAKAAPYPTGEQELRKQLSVRFALESEE